MCGRTPVYYPPDDFSEVLWNKKLSGRVWVCLRCFVRPVRIVDFGWRQKYLDYFMWR